METDDPARSRERIRLEVVVTPIFSISGDGRLKIMTTVGRPSSLTVDLTSNLTEPVEVTDFSHSFGEKADVKLDTLEPGRRYKVTLTANALERVKWAGRVSLHLKNAPVPTFTMRAFVQVRDP